MVVLPETDARFPALCRGNWGPISRKMVGAVVCQATILWVQLRERGQEKEMKLEAAAFCCHAR